MPDATPHGKVSLPQATEIADNAASPLRDANVGNEGLRRWPLWTALLLACGAAALSVDMPLARWSLADSCPTLIRNLFHCAEPFGHAVGVLLIVLVIFELDRPRRRVLPLLLAAAWGAGLAADLAKMLIARVRPYRLPADFHGGVWSTFEGWLPMYGVGSAQQSFPSAHAATAAAFAVVLTAVYPAGRRIFPLLALLVACQRVESGFHYPSDVLVGAAVGLVVGVIVRNCALRRGMLGGGLPGTLHEPRTTVSDRISSMGQSATDKCCLNQDDA